MATITKTDHGSYRVRWRDPLGNTQSKSFKRRAEADVFRIETEGRLRAGSYTPPALGKTPFGQWAEQVGQSRLGVRATTKARDDNVMANMVLPAFEDLPLMAVTPGHVQSWIADLDSRGYAPNTTRKAYQLLKRVIDAAVSSDLIPRSPCRGITLPKVEFSEMRFLGAGEVHQLAEAIDPRYRAMVLLAGSTGVRFGEAAGLTVDRLQWLKRSMIVSQTLIEVSGRVELRQTTKTAASRRTISLPGFLVDALAAHVAEYPGEDGFVFTSPGGCPLRRTNWRQRAWLPAVRGSVGEPMRFHDLRHSHAAQMIAAGEHPKVIQGRLGHTSIRTTLDLYGHLFDGLDERAADRIDAMYREATASDPCQIRSAEVIALPHQ